ncbi:PiggyBac transposable element-derived protein 3 [Nymphon striatum]|nr:PiggyBac transposable element-derived protein 3 [Nymphon striatum]
MDKGWLRHIQTTMQSGTRTAETCIIRLNKSFYKIENLKTAVHQQVQKVQQHAAGYNTLPPRQLEVLRLYVCFFCEKTGRTGDLRSAGTFGLNAKIEASCTHKQAKDILFIRSPSIRRSVRIRTSEQIIQIIEEPIPDGEISDISDSSDDEEEWISPEPLAGDQEPLVLNTPDSDYEEDSNESVLSGPQTKQRVWRKSNCQKREPQFLSSQTGPALNEFANCNTATDFFLKFMDEEIINDLVFQTNLYATQGSRRFKPVSRDEFLSFLGINMLMGYHNLPSWRNYWSTAADLHVDIVKDTMSRNRFGEILSNLHANDNSIRPNECADKLYKLRPFIDQLNNNFKLLYHLDQIVSIDESMILFKGRSSIKQYNPMKPIKRGYKIWCRANTNGYISKFCVYQGKDSGNDDLQKKFGLGGKVIITMADDIFNKNHILVFDNYFSSVPLMEFLLTKKTMACGTIRPDRKGFPELTDSNTLERGDFDYKATTDGIVCYKWKDNRPVHLISNYHGQEAGSVKRTLKNGTKKDFPCPQVVVDYNSHMGGVDKADMLRSIYGLNRKSKKWWHRLFWGFVDVVVINSYIIYSQQFENEPLLDFRRSLAMGLLSFGKEGDSPKRRKTSFSVAMKRIPVDITRHWNYNVHFSMLFNVD